MSKHLSQSTKMGSLSVIIPNYNKGIYIEETINSVLQQTFLPQEIIIVDDASTDCSKQTIINYSKKYPSLIKAIFLKKNQGVQSARNIGVDSATSEYITFIDSDDFYQNKNKLENEMKLAANNKVVYSWYCFYDQNKSNINYISRNKRSFLFFKRNTLYCYLKMIKMEYWPFCFIIARDTFIKVGKYNFKYNYYEDLDLLIRLKLNKIRISITNEVGLAIRSGASDVEHLSSQTYLYEDAVKELKKKYAKKMSIFSFLKGKTMMLLDRIWGLF